MSVFKESRHNHVAIEPRTILELNKTIRLKKEGLK